MNVLLISTYELGHQPLHVASPAARLRDAGHRVRALDLAVEPWSDEAVGWADAVAISVPMHTAMRLGVAAARRIRRQAPATPVALYGLYAGVGSDRTVGEVADHAVVGEYEPRLVAWVHELADGAHGGGVDVDLGRHGFGLPARDLLPPLDRYARLDIEGERVLAGYVEASHGCRHRCRHCPIPSVYDGLFRIVGVDSVLGDVAQLVEAGARHVTLGDPDFLNGPAYARKVLEAISSTFPDLTLDVTVKVEHLLARADMLPALRRAGVLFVVSAFETTSDRILGLLDKGHSAADMARAVQMCRRAGMEVHPSWMPFTPWTRVDDVADIFCFIDDHDLFGFTDPVQLSIRLLVPDGSLVLGLPEMAPHLRGYDHEGLTHRWVAADPAVDRLQSELAGMAAEAADGGADPTGTVLRMWRRTVEAMGGDPGGVPATVDRIRSGPRLTEPWFCCAEPTEAQVGLVGSG